MVGSSDLSPAFWTLRSPSSHTVRASGSQQNQHSHAMVKFRIFAPLSRHSWFKTSKNATLTRNSKRRFFRNCSLAAQFALRNRQRPTPLMQFEGLDFAPLHISCATGDLCRLDVCLSHIIWKSYISICVDLSRRLRYVISNCTIGGLQSGRLQH